MYDLESVVVHQSESGKAEVEKGHYFTYSKRGHQVMRLLNLVRCRYMLTRFQWFLFNDDQVSVANINDVLEAQAYVLFYRMRMVLQSSLCRP